MHKLMEYICNELEEIERKAEKNGNLSASEVEYADKLLHMKKNLLKSEEMMEESDMSYAGEESGQSRRTRSYRGSSYRRGGLSYDNGSSYARGRGRNARRDSMGRYSSEGGYSRAEDFKMELEELMEDAPNDRIRQKISELMRDM